MAASFSSSGTLPLGDGLSAGAQGLPQHLLGEAPLFSKQLDMLCSFIVIPPFPAYSVSQGVKDGSQVLLSFCQAGLAAGFDPAKKSSNPPPQAMAPSSRTCPHPASAIRPKAGFRTRDTRSMTMALQES